jgi:hypothetical protein
LIFGSYGFVKYFIEKLRIMPLEFILKLLYFNFTSAIIIFLYKLVLLNIPNINIYLLIIFMEFAFIVYDYTLTAFISFANNKLIKKIK